jgi:hypothetical protein
MKHFTTSGLSLCVALACTGSTAAELDIEVQNITHGMYFAPLLLSAHSADLHLFNLGEAATPEVQAMAEGGNISGLNDMAEAMGANNIANPAAGPLTPGMSASATLSTTDGNVMLSITGMMVPTNDGFVGLDSWPIPTEAGTYVLYLDGYDAGTEANDEIRGSGAPGTPGLPVLPFFES